MTTTRRLTALVLGGTAALLVTAGVSLAAEGASDIKRQTWSFSGPNGLYDKEQLQRGFQVYKEVCSACHGLERIAFRNLAQKGGPEFPEEAVKALAATYMIKDDIKSDGKVVDRPARLSDRFPRLYANEQEARSIHNGALPPDLSVMARARNVEYHGSWYVHPFSMLRDIAVGYQEGGADYIYALMTQYTTPPAGVTVSDGMNYNTAFAGHQIAMANPFAGGDGQVTYSDGTPATVANYSKDVAAFLSRTADPTLNERKSTGWLVMIYLLITTVLLYLGKRALWAKFH